MSFHVDYRIQSANGEITELSVDDLEESFQNPDLQISWTAIDGPEKGWIYRNELPSDFNYSNSYSGLITKKTIFQESVDVISHLYLFEDDSDERFDESDD